jgi:hypothetical protein
MPKTPRLHTFVIFIAVRKRIKISYKVTDRFVAETLLYLLHTQIYLLLLYIIAKICQNQKWDIFALIALCELMTVMCREN